MKMEQLITYKWRKSVQTNPTTALGGESPAKITMIRTPIIMVARTAEARQVFREILRFLSFSPQCGHVSAVGEIISPQVLQGTNLLFWASSL
jgi:hypothetical protein